MSDVGLYMSVLGVKLAIMFAESLAHYCAYGFLIPQTCTLDVYPYDMFMYGMYVCGHSCMYVYACMCVCICIHIHTYILYIYISTHTYIHTCVCICIFLSLMFCVSKYLCM